MAQIIAITNQKGGVGKTTSAINIAAGLAAMQKNVLLVDLDPQGNASTGSGLFQKFTKTTHHWLTQNSAFDEVVLSTDFGFDVVPADYSLTASEVALMNHPRKAFFLKNALSQLAERYQYIILDCPPSLNNLTLNALACANHIIVPVQCEFFALEGLTKLLGTIEQIKKQFNPSLKILGLLRTMFDGRSRLTQNVSDDLENHFSRLVFKTLIPRNIRLAEAPSHGKPSIYHDKRSQGSLAYLALSAEIDRKIYFPQTEPLLEK